MGTASAGSESTGSGLKDDMVALDASRREGRRARRRGEARRLGLFGLVVALAIAAVLVADELGAFAPAPAPPVPLATTLSLGTAVAGANYPTTYWIERISIQHAAMGLLLSDVSFSVETPEGAPVVPPGTANVPIISTTNGDFLASFSLNTGQWGPGAANTPMTSNELLNMTWYQTTNTDPLTGDLLVVFGHDGYTGNVTAILA